MKNRFDDPNTMEQPIERVKAVLDSKKDAVDLVKAFWQAMPHGHDLVASLHDNNWEQELTVGDKTRVRKGMLLEEKGKWVASFSGNHQPLSAQAVAWLREKGYNPDR